MFERIALAGLLAAAAGAASAAEERMVVTLHGIDADGVGVEVGTITVSGTPWGVLFAPQLIGIPPGQHGFHLHANPDCGAAMKGGEMTAGAAAGGHFDPGDTGRHEGPYGNGHLGDLPPLFAGDDTEVTLPVLAPRLKLEDVPGHALMLHAGGDDYADEPDKLGGGGARIACGVVSNYAASGAGRTAAAD